MSEAMKRMKESGRRGEKRSKKRSQALVIITEIDLYRISALHYITNQMKRNKKEIIKKIISE